MNCRLANARDINKQLRAQRPQTDRKVENRDFQSSLWACPGESVKTIEGYAVLNFDVASSNSFRDIFKKKHFVTAAADIDDSIN